MFAESQGDNFEKKIVIQGTFQGTHGKGRSKLRWSDGLKEITGHSLNTLPYWRVTDAGEMVSYHGSQWGSRYLKMMTTTKPKGQSECDTLHFAYPYIDWIEPKILWSWL